MRRRRQRDVGAAYVRDRDCATDMMLPVAFHWRDAFVSVSRRMYGDELAPMPVAAATVARVGEEFLSAVDEGDSAGARTAFVKLMGASLAFVETARHATKTPHSLDGALRLVKAQPD